MTHFVVLLLAAGIGVIAGLRALTAAAVVSWAAALHWINLNDTWASWMDTPVTVTLLTILALIELVTDKLPSTPDRTIAVQFGARLVLGAFAAAVIGTAWGYPWSALGAGVCGAAVGTFGGYEIRKRLVPATGGHHLSVALLEDLVAVLGGIGIAALVAVA
ncbi:DUF4126 family protein [Mycobacterium koreense]|uniref:DUF4126 domain-containing protein n=1 Tax=Mycolicibacillus koreensis TaxID=1069220 RepID=A0A7I7SB29_9MYCO|nr:DUF4126 family protein [Mycolicibacillus koreensis]MCV7249479.1 DUF4126 family protein [Mycolicibacillus koreensis]ODR11358.1 DUF4126 domain-containing protein [Mycolicibacillus koreensis]OSC35164.1 DUF4126 domain-containing protein [Mycolicibacillus koreensis]BBY53396.1 membrane protein [Mycolicibacillus koreensis]